ncbi:MULTISPECIES: LysE family translocator [Pseudomonas]|jgi:threonine/homoserine/homoserine lactone efflux protein|uniref:LysE family translocator n=1 Tax=Pseudomonas gingeri TaxID=117681 RepID=A0A7Y7WEF7_9PSED|nr:MULTISPECIES: LysE family translocator [Pseudomonas]MCU1740766.1 LysE family translocator [Pseudomonas sp. 20S_6.2_Bac1]NWB47851.1 LysE family translocator [Pseudomonas gingeri]
MSDMAFLFPFLLFAIVMTGTPGPNNAMVLVSGARVGVWRTMPLVWGIAAGVALQLVILGLGLGAVFEVIPGFHTALSIVGAAYILWLAWKIASSGPLVIGDEERSPMGFFGGVVFQWINPKAWAMSISAAATYIPLENHLVNVFMTAALLAVVSTPCVGIWAVGGVVFRRFLMRANVALAFNIVMALVLLGATLPAIVRLTH